MSRATVLLTAILTAAALLPGASGQEVEIYNTERSREPFLSPREARRTVKAPPGFSVSVFAAEPDVRQPIAMTFDGRGRLWVAENYTYGESKINFDTRLRDRILILEDVDHDGRHDRRTVFWDRGRKLTSVEVGFGGVWALCAPEMLFIPDRDGDDVPDGEPVVLLDGWDEDPVRHNIVNGLRWGPDGWLYGRHGIQSTSYVGKPGCPRELRTPLNCSIWRFHPVRREFEVVVHGTTNSWGHDWNDHGELLFINTVIGHLWHAVPGAHFERMYGEDFNPHIYELLPQTADHFHWDTRETWSDVRKLGVTESSSRAGGGHAHCGLMVYLGDNWPAEYRNDIFAVNYHGRRLNRDRLVRRGATYAATHRPDFLSVGDIWFRGLDLIYGPDGGVYLSDWSDAGECHDSDGIHRTSGRIYKIVHGTPAAPAVGDLATRSDAELVELQLAPNDWWVRQARRVLAERHAAGADLTAARQALRALFREQEEIPRKLRTLWALHVTGGIEEAWLLELLRHPAEHVRVWAVRLLVERNSPVAAVIDALAARARVETSGLVLTYLASALQKLPFAGRWSVADELVSQVGLADDPVLPRMIWYGIEPAVTRDTNRAIELAERSRIAKLRRFIARRLTAEITRHTDPVDRLLLLAERRADSFQLDILEGMTEALRGRQRAEPPPAWSTTGPALRASPTARVRELARELALVFGDGRAADDLRRTLRNEAESPAARRRAMNALVQARAGGLVPVLKRLLGDRNLGADAARALGVLGDPETPALLLGAWGKLRPTGREAAIDALASRPAFARELLIAVAGDRISRADIPVFQIRRMRNLGDAEVRARLDELWPELGRISADRRELYEKYRRQLAPRHLEEADPARGRELFTKNCGSCHKLFGEGGDAAPDLTGSNRSELEYLLMNLVEPSVEVPEPYRISVVHLKDGQVLNGVVGAGDEFTMTVQTPTEKLVIERRAVRSVEETSLSLMPEGLLETLGEEEVRDLFAHLMSAGPPSGGQ